MKKTEMRNPKTMQMDKMSTSEMLSAIQEENYNAVKAIEKALPSIEKVCDEATSRMSEGGRLIYIGAGTSGRLGVLDGVECRPTFGIDDGIVVGIIAGGAECMFKAAEGEEDNCDAGINDIKSISPSPLDTVVGISVSGDAAYVVGALEYAKGIGCLTIALTSNEDAKTIGYADIPIVTDTGAEALTGSTRMKAGSAHKMVLNMISTAVMTKLGNVYENMMINLKPTNIKLKNRMINITCDIKGCDRETAEKLLEESSWNIRKAVEK
ncbi:MAG: N-acetylmuramic acid 6-phosphate etherase [Ruminococcaceae bacterium]|nr:N-acetylmuramic acid 6-phosphate etherase [Oscillospiraceae bacterium]